MKRIVILLLFFSIGWLKTLQAQEIAIEKSIWTVDYIKVHDGQLADLVKFFELNWKGARKLARKAKYIEDYQWFVLPESTDYQVVLMTKYKDQTQFDKREENFQKIFAKHQVQLVNGKSSRDMSKIVKSEEFYEPKI